jgi:hypothetical protein
MIEIGDLKLCYGGDDSEKYLNGRLFDLRFWDIVRTQE